MEINKIKVGIGRTVNIGNYESVRIDIEMTADITERENPHACTDQLRHAVKIELEKAIRAETKKQKEPELW